MAVEVGSPLDSGKDTMVETEPGMRGAALNPVRLRGRVSLSLSCDPMDHVWGVDFDWSPEKKMYNCKVVMGEVLRK